ncbi:MAG TPA: acetyl-CoA C-acetyltransferase [Terracidiphilus sp.]|jgi:acetyl-CoA C-acetyltransferase|nr:acetyl-CoA C-acetyltransferase [Terracidiphilus sp.]
MKETVIVSAVRTPVGKFQGSLQSFSAPRLGALAVREAVRRAGLELAQIDECIMGCVLQAGLGQNPARQAAIHGGLLPAVGAFTVNQVCGSGLKAVALAAQAIETGNAEILVAGGMESMTNAPYLLPQARSGYRMGNGALVDAMIHDGLWEVYNGFHMGVGAEMIAAKYGITRQEQDAFAAESQRRAGEATAQGWFREEIVAVEIPAAKKGEKPSSFDADETIRPETTVEILARLKPAFQEGGTVTAGNAPGISDGAAALVVTSPERARELGAKPLAVIRAQSTSGVEPAWFGLAPIEAVRKAAARAGWPLDSVDLFELNEAFSVQALAVIRDLGLDPAKVNVHGGAVAIGHPIGASGARVLTTLLYALERYDKTRGIAALCLGGGNAVALAVERV